MFGVGITNMQLWEYVVHRALEEGAQHVAAWPVVPVLFAHPLMLALGMRAAGNRVRITPGFRRFSMRASLLCVALASVHMVVWKNEMKVQRGGDGHLAYTCFHRPHGWPIGG